MKLDVSATRHPSAASRLLVTVQDQNGPVDGLANNDFQAFVWASRFPPPVGYGGGGRFDLPVLAASELAPGFYALRLGLTNVRVGDDFDLIGADDLGALVVGVIARRADDVGNAIAVTPLRGEAP
jgi:hypothetical protein